MQKIARRAVLSPGMKGLRELKTIRPTDRSGDREGRARREGAVARDVRGLTVE
jgi:hypothetical protein